jgi:N-acetylneuraminate lyase
VSIIDLLTQALERLPSMAGVKYSSPKVDEFSACVDRFNGRFTMMFGRDQMLLSALSAGASAAVGSTYNYAAPLYRKLWNAFETGDMATARLCQHRAVRFIEILAAFGGVRASKVFMKLSGVDVGPPRLPLQPLSSDEERSLGQRLEEIGFFEWRTG